MGVQYSYSNIVVRYATGKMTKSSIVTPHMKVVQIESPWNKRGLVLSRNHKKQIKLENSGAKVIANKSINFAPMASGAA